MNSRNSCVLEGFSDIVGHSLLELNWTSCTIIYEMDRHRVVWLGGRVLRE